jgi:hypothetical protein
VRTVLLGALVALAPAPALAGGGFVCTDACSRNPQTGVSCDDMGMGCNPITGFCSFCSADSHCAPNGSCVDRTCVNLVCTYDAGVDAGDVGADAADAGDPMDAETEDAEPDAAPVDAEPQDASAVDTAFPDARDPTDPLPGPRPMAQPKEPFDDEQCGCTTTPANAEVSWIGLAVLLLIRKLSCKRAQRA